MTSDTLDDDACRLLGAIYDAQEAVLRAGDDLYAAVKAAHSHPAVTWKHIARHLNVTEQEAKRRYGHLDT